MQKTQAHNLPALPEPAAHMYPSDLTRFAESETFAHAYSIAVGNPDERSQPLFTAEQMCAYASEARVEPVEPSLSGARSNKPAASSESSVSVPKEQQ